MFRNLRLYRVQSEWPVSEQALSGALEARAFKPCGAYTEESAGFEPPGGEAHDQLARRVGGADLMRLRIQTRLLPAAAVNEALETRIQQFRKRTQRDPSRKEKRDLKDEVHAELMPKTLLKSQRLWGLFMIKEGLLGIDTSSETQSELFVDALRSAFGSLEVVPMSFKEPLGRLLSQVFLGSGPAQFQSGRECRMLDTAAGKASVSWMDMELTSAAVQRHVKDGLTLEGLSEAEDEVQDEHPLALLDAQFVLMAGMIQRLLLALKRELKGYA
jgi:recombination associated protein RdgC